MKWNPLKALLPSLFLVVAGFALSRTRGNYRLSFVLLFAAALLAFAYSFFAQKQRVPSWFEGVARFIVFAFSLRLAQKSLLLYPEPGMATTALHYSLVIGALASLLFLAAYFYNTKAIFEDLLMGVLFAVAAISRWLVLKASPKPFIDVYVWISEAADYFLSGVNPYGKTYTDVYARYPEYPHYPPVFNYEPGVLWWVTPFQYLFKDIRAGFIAADVVIALCLIALASALRLTKRQGAILALIWLTFPVQLFVLEQSWIDTLLAMTVAIFALSVLKRHYLLAGVALGGLIGVKQYGFLAAGVSLLWVWGAYGKKPAAYATAAAGLTACVILLPFYVASPAAFFYSVVTSLANQPFRIDSFSLAAAFQRVGISVGAWVTAGLSLAAFVVTSAFLVRRPTLVNWAGALTLSYGVLFLFAKQAFCNYYQFEMFFLSLYLAGQWASAKEEKILGHG